MRTAADASLRKVRTDELVSCACVCVRVRSPHALTKGKAKKNALGLQGGGGHVGAWYPPSSRAASSSRCHAAKGEDATARLTD